MLEIKLTLNPEDQRFDAVLAALVGSAPAKYAPTPEASKAAKTKAPIEKPVIPAQEVVEAPPAPSPLATADDKPVTLEAIREKITELLAKDKAAYSDKIKALLSKYGQKSASNLLKTDYPAFYTELQTLWEQK